jgi:hypothetical protein
MEPLQRLTPPPSPPRPTDVREGEPQPTAPLVAVVFKEHCYESGAPKAWLFAHIHHVDCVHGRLQLRREGYGVVFDVPYEEVERVYIADQDTFLPRVHASPSRQGG